MRKLLLALSPLLLAACAFQVESLDIIDERRDDVPDARETDDGPSVGDFGDHDGAPQADEPLPAWDPTRHFLAAAGGRGGKRRVLLGSCHSSCQRAARARYFAG